MVCFATLAMLYHVSYTGCYFKHLAPPLLRRRYGVGLLCQMLYQGIHLFGYTWLHAMLLLCFDVAIYKVLPFYALCGYYMIGFAMIYGFVAV